MSYALAAYAAKHFSHIPDRHQRQHAAETSLVRLFFKNAPGGYFVEVGANDPHHLSQTWHLEEFGWKGCLIEPIAQLCQRLRAERPGSKVVQAACAGPDSKPEADLFSIPADLAHASLDASCLTADTAAMRRETVKVTTLDVILEQAGHPQIDFLSIDVEGRQLDVLRGFSIQDHLPKLLFVEDHLRDMETHRYISSRGYTLVKRTGLNNWYIPSVHRAVFDLTSASERWRLWNKVVVRTPFRRAVRAIKRS